MYKAIILIGSVVGIMHASSASSESLTIKVIDDYNKGVNSRVYYNDGTHRHSFFTTDHEGKVTQPPSTCGKIRALRAHPSDSGAYFDSPAQPCASKVFLRTLIRQTPLGKAISLQIIPFNLRDGSSAVLALKPVLNSTSKDLSEPGNDPQCKIKFSAFADQHVFKIEGEDWIELKRTTTAFSNVFKNAKQPDVETVTLPWGCNAASKRIQMLKRLATDRIHRSALKNAVMFKEILQSLGYQPPNR